MANAIRSYENQVRNLWIVSEEFNCRLLVNFGRYLAEERTPQISTQMCFV